MKIVTRWTADLLDWTLKEEEPAWHSDVISVFQVKNGDVCTRRKNAHAFSAHCQNCQHFLTFVSKISLKYSKGLTNDFLKLSEISTFDSGIELSNNS